MNLPECPNSCDRRTTYSILWSCLTTIFLCTWISLHPNLPKPTREYSFVRRVIRRAEMMFVAMVAPELTTVWAMRQWSAARRMTKKYKARPLLAPELTEVTTIWSMKQWEDSRRINKKNQESRWTTAHSFLALMGGFVLVRRSKDGVSVPLNTVLPEELDIWVPKIQSQISKREICDRSKGDGVTKTLAVLQTGWFIIQFFARVYRRLDITELELATMAYAVLNIGTYIFWWSKPLNIDYPVQLSICDEVDPGQIRTGADLDLIPLIDDDDMCLTARMLASSLRIVSKDEDVQWYMRAIFAFSFPLFTVGALTMDIILWLGHLAINATDVILHDHWEFSDDKPEWRYFHGDGENGYPGSLLSILAVLFGAVHCAAWSFAFPSRTQKITWRVSASAAALFPPLIVFLLALFNRLEERNGSILRYVLYVLVFSLAVVTTILYIAARCILVIQMFLLLPSQPDSVFIAVDWIKYIPHL